MYLRFYEKRILLSLKDATERVPYDQCFRYPQEFNYLVRQKLVEGSPLTGYSITDRGRAALKTSKYRSLL